MTAMTIWAVCELLLGRVFFNDVRKVMDRNRVYQTAEYRGLVIDCAVIVTAMILVGALTTLASN